MSSVENLAASKLKPWREAGVAMSVFACLVAGYLGYASLKLKGTPWGCGADSGCANVLMSRWSNVAGVPVGFLAAPAYILLGALCAWARGPFSARLLTIISSAVLSAAIYFILLQTVIIQAICKWCMLDHSLGILASVAGLVIARRLTPRTAAPKNDAGKGLDPLAEYDDSPTVPLPPRSSALGSIGLGVAATMVFVVVQHFTAKTPDVGRIESVIAEPGAGWELAITLKNGQVTLPAANLPVMGPFAAPRRLILMFDYCCPHCREAHSVIRRLHATAGEEWQIVFVPTPLNSECNPGVEETEPRFKDACELARLSLAVWKLKTDDWPAFDAWLFEPELPRTAEEARQHAAALYGEIELAETLTKAPIDAVIAADVKVYQATGSRVLPVILSPGAAGIAGRTDGEDELRELLKKEFGFPTK